MPLADLVRVMDPPVPADVRAAADALRFRDFLTVALVVPERRRVPRQLDLRALAGGPGGPDPELRRVVAGHGQGRPHLPRAGVLRQRRRRPVGDARRRARRAGHPRARGLGLVDATCVEAGYVVRMPKAYPVYDEGYAENVAVLRGWLADACAERAPGRAQRDAPLQQPGPLDAHRDARGGEHRRERRARRLGGQRRGRLPRGGAGDGAGRAGRCAAGRAAVPG